MTYSREVYYGGSKEVLYSLASQNYTITDRDKTRVWYLNTGGDDLSLEALTFKLPDPRPYDLRGGLYFIVYNGTGSDSISIRNSQDLILETMERSDTAFISLVNKDQAQGVWTIRIKKLSSRGFADQGAQDTVSFGASTPANTDVFRYTYDTDGWVTGLSSPISTEIVSAGSVKSGTPLAYRSFYLVNADFYEYASNAHIVRDSPQPIGGYTGMTEVSNGVPLGLIQFGDTGGVNDIYNMGSDTWSNYTTSPDPDGQDNTAITLNTQVYQMIGKRGDLSNLDNFWRLSTLTASFTSLANLPAPSPRWACCLAPMDEKNIHCWNGNSEQDGLALYASRQHWKHSGTRTGTWSSQPLSIVKSQGQGVNPVDAIPNRVTFGMGNDATGSSPGHYQYNSATLAYSTRGTLVWGPRTRRENAWCGYQR
jgi:hypothetical protein